MTNLYFIRGAVVAVLLTVSATAIAEDRQPVAAQVRYGDLNLTTVAGQAALKRRILHAASATCVSVAIGLDAVTDRSRCMSEMRRDGDARLATLIAAAPTIQFASAAATALPAK